jgi:translation initiation factor 2 subunit 1
MKNEFPEEDEVLLGTVTKLIGTSVFVQLEEYSKEGVISFSEVAPGRIRNLRDYVRPGQKIVTKVLRVDKIHGHVDLSLRRVSAKEKKEVIELFNKEKEVRVLLGLVIKDKARLEQTTGKIREKMHLAELMTRLQENASEGMAQLEQFSLSHDEASAFILLITEKAKEKFVTVKTELLISTEAEDGIEKIRKLLSVPGMDIKYLSAPHYLLSIKDKDYKEANKKLKEITDALSARAKELGCSFEIKK